MRITSRRGGDSNVRDSQRLSISDWDGAVEEELSGDVSVPTPVILRRGSDDFTEGTAPSEAARSDTSSTRANRPMIKRRSTTNSVSKGGIFRRLSLVGSQDGTAAETDPSGSENGTDFTSSTGSNIWNRLMNFNDSLWDGVDGKGGFDDDDDDSIYDDEGDNQDCQKSMKRCGLTWWWETQHFFSTMVHYPHIIVITLITFGVLVGAGLAAITAERASYIEKQKSTAEFVVSPNIRMGSFYDYI